MWRNNTRKRKVLLDYHTNLILGRLPYRGPNVRQAIKNQSNASNRILLHAPKVIGELYGAGWFTPELSIRPAVSGMQLSTTVTYRYAHQDLDLNSTSTSVDQIMLLHKYERVYFSGNDKWTRTHGLNENYNQVWADVTKLCKVLATAHIAKLLAIDVKDVKVIQFQHGGYSVQIPGKFPLKREGPYMEAMLVTGPNQGNSSSSNTKSKSQKLRRS